MVCSFLASQYWLKSFIGRYDFALGRKTHVSQRLPDEICEKVEHFQLYMQNYFKRQFVKIKTWELGPISN